MDFEKEIINILKKEVKGTITLETPQNKEFGDYSFPCFSLAKEYKKNPVEIAKDLVKKLKITKSIKEIKNIGGYVNFFVDKSSNTKNILEEILKKKDKYGMTDIGKNKKALIEHTSINPNASPHVGRARNAIIGDSITRILKFSNYKVEVHYFVNDVGKQIALLVLGCKSKTKFDNLLKIYIKMNKKLEKDPKLEKKVFELLQKLEKGNKKVKDKFKRTVNICIKGQTKLFSELGINYDYFDYESKYLWSKEVTKILNKLKKTKKVFVDEHKRNVLDQSKFKLAMKSPVLVLTRSDGTSLYPLRDITYNLDKIKKADKNIVVLGEDHKLYFLQLKAALSLLKIKAPEVIHYSFILLKKGKMSTRKGNLVMLEDFMKECREKAKKEIIKRHGKVKNLDKLTKIIGYGALKYSILKVSPDKNVLFDWEKALNFEGDSGPYIQYAYARASSILRKGKIGKVDYSVLKDEINLIEVLKKFPEIVLKEKPHLIANYAFELAQNFNEFYRDFPVLKAEEKVKNARLLLVKVTKQVLKNSLYLLGIEAPERM